MSSFQVPFYSEKAISEIVTLSFFSQLFFWNFLNFFGHIFLHAFSQWLFKYVPDQSYIFSSMSSLQGPFYSEKAILEIVTIIFFLQLFFWNFLNFFGHIFLHAFSQWLFKYVPDQSYIFHQWAHFKGRFTAKKRFSEIVTRSFFSQLFFWNFLNFFGHIFLHAFSQLLFKYVPDQSYIFNQWVHFKCRQFLKSLFRCKTALDMNLMVKNIWLVSNILE